MLVVVVFMSSQNACIFKTENGSSKDMDSSWIPNKKTDKIATAGIRMALEKASYSEN